MRSLLWPRWPRKFIYNFFFTRRYGDREGKSCDVVAEGGWAINGQSDDMSALSVCIRPGFSPSGRRRRRLMRFPCYRSRPKAWQMFPGKSGSSSLFPLSSTCLLVPFIVRRLFETCAIICFSQCLLATPHPLTVSNPPVPSFLVCHWWRPSHRKQAWTYQLCEDTFFWTADSPALHPQGWVGVKQTKHCCEVAHILLRTLATQQTF